MQATTHNIDIDQGSLLLRQWQPDQEPLGVLQMLHGMGEHSERYQAFADFMAGRGWVVYCHDHRQHGHSINHDAVGILGESDRWEAYVHDVEVVRRWIRHQYPDLPMVMLGHSMGSLILRTYLHTHKPDIQGSIIMGSPYAGKSSFVLGKWLASLITKVRPLRRSRLLAKILNDPLLAEIKDYESDSDWLCMDKAVVEAYDLDPLCGYDYSPIFYREFCKGFLLANEANLMSQYLRVPTLIISGKDDPAGDMGKGPLLASRWYRSFGLDCRLRLMDGMRHEVLNEYGKEEVYQVILDFVSDSL